ncbi:MAG TPA: adenylate/guanylate cyclase domain-containing protein [Actinomycetota bacterium]|nr:adenylate/guanylate cyclase domain-containing protein [Actinomycetota bacterium]
MDVTVRDCPACGTANAEGARFCNACGERLPETAAAPEVRKTVTVVFCDVTGSTALGERLDPEALRRVMTRYFEAMTRAIEAHEGTVEKFIGDAVMAVFGIPTTHEDDALRAVRAAADMRTALGVLNKELERDHGATLACRIGVNTGEVVAGDATARQSLVVGDAVNVAARLEQAAPPGEIYLSAHTLELVRDAVVAEPVPPLELKGKAAPVTAAMLVEVHPDAPGHARRFDTPLVGRERQLAQLRQAFEEVAAERVCTLITVIAPPGTGKSRLVREFLSTLDAGATAIRGRCLAYGEGVAFFPLAELVRDAIGEDELDPDPAAAIEARLPDDEHATRVATMLAGLVGGPDDLAAADETAWAARRLFQALSREGPLVVVIDDIQWAEPGMLDLIDHVSDWSRDAPILLLCMARPELLEARPDWGGGKLRAANASLEPLSEAESAELVTHLGGAGLDDDTRARILTTAEGNPLFVEEIVAMLAEDRGADEGATIPPTINALLAARLDRLEEADRAVLGRASVVGEVFYLDAVRALAPEGEREGTAERVRGLLRREMIRPGTSDLPGLDAYRFHHVLLRDAAYAMVPKEARADLHEALAAWLDERSGTEADEFVGYHLGQAADLRAELGPTDTRGRDLAAGAAARLSRAGRRAAEREDVPGARALFARATALHPADTAERGWDLFRYTWMLLDDDTADDAWAAIQEAGGAAAASGDARLDAQVRVTQEGIRQLLAPGGGLGQLREMIERLRPGFEAAGDDEGLALLWYVSHLESWLGCRFAEARAILSRALEYALAAGDRQFARRSATTRGAAGWYGSTPVPQMLADSEDIEALASGAPLARVLVANARASILGIQGREAESEAEFEHAYALAREFRGVVPAALQHPRAQLAVTRDRPAEAVPIIEASYEETRSQHDLAHLSTVAGALASLYVSLGRLDEAHPLAEECRTLGDPADIMNEIWWRRVESRLAAHAGDAELARRLMDETLAILDGTDVLMDLAETHVERAEVEQLLGDTDAARAALAAAADAYRAKGALLGEERVARRLVALDAGEGP